ncbi:TetR family transcriptional regulator [Micromonospora endophytica]|uniref:TetR/AcrR family transcriptional regulator n=1 Tax=Micromonospora endophytica TaxID=515350 RepID=A0A2W2E0Q1_9ACTN|nr:TetR family transcriptional regulator [Micromonospora endophytica]PZF98553.1 TetR/AcrR family transcriptional regulator [Micromonospora endophytica]RIW43525.1 TetR/AcrR family transcriptional regulator [Micromonospora endophytica]BCJ62839.1 TetR family transcriptional regulator [Micromonospora endophytica]
MHSPTEVTGAGNAPAHRTPAARSGRKDRWADHREQRRRALIAAAVQALLRYGPQVDMEQVASTAGVSKPVLYRYFADKSQLWLAVGEHVAARVVEAVAPAVERVREERDLVEATIDAYLGVIESQPRLYQFLVHQSGVPGIQQLLAGTSQQVATGLARVISDRLHTLGLDAGPAEPWAYGLVGFVQAVGDWWTVHGQPIDRAALTDYLTILLWSGIEGVRRSAELPRELTRASGQAGQFADAEE